MYIDNYTDLIVEAVAIGLTIPPALFLSVLSFARVNGKIASAKRWILFLRIACSLYTTAGVLTTAVLAASLGTGDSFATSIVDAIALLIFLLSNAFLFLVLFEVVGWFADLRNGEKAATRSKWAKCLGPVAFALLTILNIVWFGLRAQYFSPDYHHDMYDTPGAELIIMVIFILSAFLGLVLLGISIATLVKAKKEPHLRKASQSFVIAAAFTFLPYLWRMITWVILATVYDSVFGLLVFSLFIYWWLPVIALGFLYRLASVNVDQQSPFEDVSG